MSHCRCGSAVACCPRADRLFGVQGLHVLDVTAGDGGRLVIDVESDATLTGCPDCGVVAVGHGRRVQVLHDTPSFGRPVRVRWAKRIWRCPEAACPAADLDRGPRLRRSVCWNAIQSAARTFVARPERVRGVRTIGVDEHIWRPSRNASKDKAVTVLVDLSRDEDGYMRARLLDAVPGRSGRVFADWLSPSRASRSPSPSSTPLWTRSAAAPTPTPNDAELGGAFLVARKSTANADQSSVPSIASSTGRTRRGVRMRRGWPR